MQIPDGAGNAAAPMMCKRLIATGFILCLGAALASCGGASENGFSSYVADHWPHWAGGMPADVPPRPGQPGYAEFIAHGQADQQPTKTVAPAAQPVAAPPANQPVATAAPAPAPPVEAAQPSDAVPEEDSSGVRGGLY